jgi:cation:H+ antiporter
VACLPIFFTGYAIVRWEGILFVGYLLAYMTYLFLQSSEREALERLFDTAMIGFVIPLTIVTLMVVVWRELRARKLRSILGSGPSTGTWQK